MSGADWPGLASLELKIAKTTQPVKQPRRLQGVPMALVYRVGRVEHHLPKIEIEIDNPVALGRGLPPVVVLEQVADAAAGGGGSAVQDIVVRDENRPRGRRGQYPPADVSVVLHEAARPTEEMCAGHQRCWSHFFGCILRVIEHLQKVKLPCKHPPAIAVPVAGYRHRAHFTMVAHQGRQFEVFAQERPYCARRLRILEDPFDEPVFFQDLGRFYRMDGRLGGMFIEALSVRRLISSGTTSSGTMNPFWQNSITCRSVSVGSQSYVLSIIAEVLSLDVGSFLEG